MARTPDSNGPHNGQTNAECPRRRPGGRSARVSAAVFAATLAALREQGTDFTIPQIAERAGVHDATIYRRWGSKEALIVDAVRSHVGGEIPIPDTGSLRSDLLVFLRESIAFLASPLGGLLVRATASSAVSGMTEARQAYWSNRFARIGEIFVRAKRRGEIPSTADTTLATEMLLAPLYLRLLVTHEPLDDALAERIANLVIQGLAG